MAEAVTHGAEAITVEMRAEVIRTIAVRGERRRGALDRLEVGPEPASDVVDGDETVEVHGDVHEKTGGVRTNVSRDVDWHVDGLLTMHVHGATTLLGGMMAESFAGPTTLLAGMSDDLVGGGGIRATGPADVWIAGLYGMEEKMASATGDAMVVDMGRLVIEREYGVGLHNFGTAVFSGALYQTQASGFLQLYRIWNGVRNMTPGGGAGEGSAEGGGGGAPAATPAIPPVEGALLATSTARAGTRLEDVNNTEDAVKLARVAEDGATVGEDTAQLGEDARAARLSRAEALEEVRRLAEAGEAEDSEEALTRATRLLAGYEPMPTIMEESGGLDELGVAEDAQAFDNPNWVEVLADLEDTRVTEDAGTQADDLPKVIVTGPEAPKGVEEIPRDEVDNTWKQLLDAQQEALENLDHSRPNPAKSNWEIRNPGGRQQSGYNHLRQTQEDLRNMLIGIIGPYASSMGLTPETLRTMDSGDAASDTLMLRKQLQLLIARLDEAGEAEKAADLRRALAGFDSTAERRIADAITHADDLAATEVRKLSENTDVDALVDALSVANADALYADGSFEMNPEKLRISEFYGTAIVKAEQGYDPTTFLLELRASYVARGQDVTDIDAALADILRVVETHDPALANIGEAGDIRSLLVAQRNDAIRGGDIAGAMEVQRRIDMYDVDPVRYASLGDSRKAFQEAMASGRSKGGSFAPPGTAGTERDEFDAVYKQMLIARWEQDVRYQRTASTDANPTGLHETGHNALQDAIKTMDDMMEQMVGPYLDELGATDADILKLRSDGRSAGEGAQNRPNHLRQWYKHAIEQAELAGEVEKAAEMRQALADYDAMATRLMTSAMAEADWLSSFPGVKYGPETDVDAAINEISERFVLIGSPESMRNVPEDEKGVRGEAAFILVRAQMALEDGRDPMPEVLEITATLTRRYGNHPAFQENVDFVRRVMFEYDPSIGTRSADMDMSSAEGLRWIQRQLLYAGNFEAAMDIQRQIDMLAGRPVPVPQSNWDFWMPPEVVQVKPDGAPGADGPRTLNWVPADVSFSEALDPMPPPALAKADPPPPTLIDTLFPVNPGAATDAFDIVHLDDLPVTLESAGPLVFDEGLGILRPGTIEVEDAPVALADGSPVAPKFAADPGAAPDGNVKPPEIAGWRPPEVDAPPATPEINDLGATWNEAADIAKPPGRRSTHHQDLNAADWRKLAESVANAPRHPEADDIPAYRLLPADFPTDETTDALTRQITKLLPRSAVYDEHLDTRVVIAQARANIIQGENPLPIIDAEIAELNLKRTYGGGLNFKEDARLEALVEGRSIIAAFVPPPAPPAPTGVRKLPDDIDIAATLAEWEEARTEQTARVRAAKAKQDAIPAPPALLNYLNADEYAAWDEVHGEAYRAAEEAYKDELNIYIQMFGFKPEEGSQQEPIPGLIDLAEFDLRNHDNPMARIEAQKAQLRALNEISPSETLTKHIEALERLGDTIMYTVPPLPPNAIGPDADARRYLQAFERMDELNPRRFTYNVTPDSAIDPTDLIDPDGVDNTWQTMLKRIEQGQADSEAAIPQVEEGDPPPGVRPGGLHVSGFLHLEETRTELNTIMRQLLESSGLSGDDLAYIDFNVGRGDPDATDKVMELRKWYQHAIAQMSATDPARAAEMRATLANFDALAEREIAEAMAHADWLADFKGVPLSPNIDQRALAADLRKATEDHIGPDPWMADDAAELFDTAGVYALAERAVMDGLDPMARILEWRATKVIERGVDPSYYDEFIGNILALLMKHDPTLRQFPDVDDALAHKVWQRNELLYSGDLEGALDIQRQIDALQADAAVTPLDEVVDADGEEVRRLFGDELAPVEGDWTPAEPEPIDETEFQAILAGIPGGGGESSPSPSPTPSGEVEMFDPQVAADFEAFLGATADGVAPGLPADDAIAPARRIPAADGAVPAGGTSGVSGVADPTAAQVEGAVEPMAGRAAVSVETWPAPNADPVEVLDPGARTAERVTASATVDVDELRAGYRQMEWAFGRWIEETASAEGPYDLAGVDAPAQRMFETWRTRPNRTPIPEGTDLDGLHATLLSRGLDYTGGARRPPADFVETADPAALNAWLALHEADMDLRRMARSFEGVLREHNPPGFDLMTDLDDITKVRQALLAAADGTGDVEEAMSLRAMAASIDDYLYRTATEAIARADRFAAGGAPRLSDRVYQDYAAREIEALANLSPTPLGDEANEAYARAMRLSAAYVEAGEDPVPWLDTQVRFLEAQVEDAGDNPARRRALQAQLDGYRAAQTALGGVMTKWTRPPETAVPGMAGFEFNQTWAWIQAEPNTTPRNVQDPETGRFHPYVPGEVETGLEDLAAQYAARIEGDIPAAEYDALDKTDLAAVRARIEQLRQDALAKLDSPVGGPLTADPNAANRYGAMLEDIDARAYYILDDAGLAGNLDGAAVRARFPDLSASMDEWAPQNGAVNWEQTGLTDAQADAFLAWRQSQSLLDPVAKKRLKTYVRSLRLVFKNMVEPG